MSLHVRSVLLCHLFLVVGWAHAWGQGAFVDLRHSGLDESRVVRLSGQSEFYWRQFLTPADFARGVEFEPSYVSFPDTWTNYRLEGGNLPADGYATYRFFVILSVGSKEEHYGLRIPVVYSSYRLWVNGEYCKEMGRVDSSPFKSVSKAGVALVPVHASGSQGVDTLEVVLQVANYGYPLAGMRHGITFGHVGSLVAHSAMQIRIEFLLLGVLSLLIVFCAVFLRIAYRGLNSIWVFLSGCFFIVHIVTNNGNFFFELFPSVPWIAFHILRYAALLLASLSSLMFVYQTFTRRIRSYLFYPLAGLGVLLLLYVIMAPSSHYGLLGSLITVYLVLVFGGIMAVTLPRVRDRQSPLSMPLVVGMTLLALCYCLDVFVYRYAGNLQLPFTQLGAILLSLSVMLPTVRRISDTIGERETMRRDHALALSELRTKHVRELQRNSRLEIELSHTAVMLERQQWAEMGFAQINETISQSPRKIGLLSQALMDVFCKYISVKVGALYMARYSLETMQANLVLTADVGLTERMRTEQAVVLENEGLVGAVYARNTMRYLTDLPGDFLTISTGLGECSPPALLILPLQADSGVIGVLALGKLEEFGEHEIAFAQRAALVISNSLMHVSSVEDNLRMTREALEAHERLRQEQDAMRQQMLRLEALLQERGEEATEKP